MNTYNLKVTIDRPNTSMDVVLEQVNADFNIENVTSAKDTLAANFSNMETISEDTVIKVETEYKNEQGEQLLSVNTPNGVTKLEINTFFSLISQLTQSTPQDTNEPV